ncbi:MAG: hypothetical protein JNM56_40115 [Planctomycetia bacterium]|nr:hypothetical protein [Planctomycetia bacterium]
MTGEPPPSARRMTMPCRWRDGGLGEFAGRVRFRRRFGLPRQIDAHERLWLTFAGIEGAADLSLNGQHLARTVTGPYPLAYEVTALMQPRNELTVEVAAPDGDGGLWGEVTLEIRATAYLKNVRIVPADAGRLQVMGEIAGSADRPLDLYILVANRTVHYSARTAGEPFAMVTDAPESMPSGPVEARVELVNGGVVWYRISESVTFPA